MHATNVRSFTNVGMSVWLLLLGFISWKKTEQRKRDFVLYVEVVECTPCTATNPLTTCTCSNYIRGYNFLKEPVWLLHTLCMKCGRIIA